MTIDWQTMTSAPRDKTVVALYHVVHGVIEGWYDPPYQESPQADEFQGEWVGPVWVLGDDVYQEEVEIYPDGSYHDGQIIAWAPQVNRPEWAASEPK